MLQPFYDDEDTIPLPPGSFAAQKYQLLISGTDTAFALTQYLLADALELSAVHVNRVLRLLRRKGLVTFRKGCVAFDDFEGLCDVAAFDNACLDHEGPPLR